MTNINKKKLMYISLIILEIIALIEFYNSVVSRV